MGLFQRKQQASSKAPIDETTDGVQRFFDGYFAELKTRGRAHFEKSVEENATRFKKDLDAVIAKADTELKEHIASELDVQIAANNEVMKHAQERALESLTRSAEAFRKQHEELSASLQKSVADHQAILAGMFEQNKQQITAMQTSQAEVLQWLAKSVQTMQTQQEQLAETMQQNVAKQQEVLVHAFEQNMAQIVEHYLLGALGDQYDLKAQLPSIIHEMETNKQAIVDDMKL